MQFALPNSKRSLKQKLIYTLTNLRILQKHSETWRINLNLWLVVPASTNLKTQFKTRTSSSILRPKARLLLERWHR